MNAPGGPERLGAYRLVEQLGHGGMAVVYRAERTGDAGFKKKVAIKRILPAYRRDPSLLERFAAEARTNARLDHPNLVQVLDFGIEPEPYLVLEFIEGVTLGEVLQRLSERKERLEIAAAVYIAAEAASGLDHAHRKRDDDGTPLGIVHRDVSPQNVLLSNEGTVKVSDFGLVKAADNVLKTQSGVSIGKLSYMAPEQAAGDDVDARADVFALGVTLWEMLTVRSLIPPDDPERAARMLRSGDFPRPSQFNPEVSTRLEQIVMNCLALDPAQRTPSAQQLSQDLREFLHETAPGYGRQQLARLLQWLFPHKGWDLPEPERPPAQPSPDERASFVPPTPVAIAVARAAPPSQAPPASTPPSTSKRRLLFGAAATVGCGVLLVVALAVALGVAYWRTSASSVDGVSPTPASARAEHVYDATSGAPVTAPATSPPTAPTATSGAPVTAPATSPPTAPAATPAPSASATGVTIHSATPELRLFLGTTELGPPPVRLPVSQLLGEPLVALAPLHRPQLVRAERLLELARTDRVLTLTLTSSQTPDVLVYVRYDGQGVVRLPGGRPIGQAPGVVIVPTQRGVAPPLRLELVDELSGRARALPILGCDAEHVCTRAPLD